MGKQITHSNCGVLEHAYHAQSDNYYMYERTCVHVINTHSTVTGNWRR